MAPNPAPKNQPSDQRSDRQADVATTPRRSASERESDAPRSGSPKTRRARKTEDDRRQYGSGSLQPPSEKTGARWKAVIEVSQPGDPVRRRKTARFATEAAAKNWLRVQGGRRADGIVAAPPTSTGAYLVSWLNGPYVACLAPSTQRQYRHVVEQYLVPTLGKVPMNKLTPTRIGSALAQLAKPGAVPPAKAGRARNDDTLAPRSVNLARSILRSALTKAVQNGIIQSNPASAAPLPWKRGTIRPQPQPLTDAELDAVGPLLLTYRIGPLVRLALATGLREGELLALRLVDVDASAQVLRVEGSLSKNIAGRFELTDTTKTGKRRAIPLGEIALDALRAEGSKRANERLAAGRVWSDHGLVFASPIGTPLGPRNVLRAWHDLCNAAGIDRRPFHHLRHSAATYLLTGGLPMEAVSKILGHSTLAVTSSTYAEVRDRLTAPAASILDNALGKAMRRA